MVFFLSIVIELHILIKYHSSGTDVLSESRCCHESCGTCNGNDDTNCLTWYNFTIKAKVNEKYNSTAERNFYLGICCHPTCKICTGTKFN